MMHRRTSGPTADESVVLWEEAEQSDYSGRLHLFLASARPRIRELSGIASQRSSGDEISLWTAVDSACCLWVRAGIVMSISSVSAHGPGEQSGII